MLVFITAGLVITLFFGGLVEIVLLLILPL